MTQSSTPSPPPLKKASLSTEIHHKSLPPSPPPSTKSLPRSQSQSPSQSRSQSRSNSSKPVSRSSSHTTPTSRELLILLTEAENTCHQLRADISQLNSQLLFEQDRADDAELKAKDACTRFKDANNLRLSSQSQVARLTEELRLYKDALETAQKEIFRAQAIMRDVEERRREVEEENAKLRSKLRKMNEEKMLDAAREQGRKQGLQEGLERGKDLGYVHGRNKGYQQGRVTADRVLDRYFSPPSEDELRRSNIDTDEATTTRYPPQDSISRSSSADNPPTSPRPRTRQSRPPHTQSARNSMFSPAHALHDIPPDGWIPEADSSLIIRLPAPYEFQRHPPTSNSPSPISSSPASPLAPLPVPLDNSVLMVPEPRSPGTPLYTMPLSDSRPPRTIRRKSSGTESIGSTRMSELELLSAPDYPATNRSSGLSVIPEQSTPSSKSMKPSVEDDVDESGFVHVSMPAPRTPSDMSRLQRPPCSPSASRSPARDMSRPASTSSFGTVNITIQPPSRPASNNSQATVSVQRSHLLSPADADRPVPLPSHVPSPAQATPSMVPLPPTGSTMPMSLPDGQLPLGFVPSVAPTPHTQYTASGVPLPPPSGGTPYHRAYTDSQSMQEDELVVIPPPSQKFARESDESSSDTDTLTTPPARYRPAGSAASLYTGASRYTGVGVPLPPSTVGSGTPYSYGRNVGGDGYMNMNAGVTPGGFGRPMSFASEQGASVRG